LFAVFVFGAIATNDDESFYVWYIYDEWRVDDNLHGDSRPDNSEHHHDKFTTDHHNDDLYFPINANDNNHYHCVKFNDGFEHYDGDHDNDNEHDNDDNQNNNDNTDADADGDDNNHYESANPIQYTDDDDDDDDCVCEYIHRFDNQNDNHVTNAGSHGTEIFAFFLC
jgi:hypothetical protein